MLHSRKELGIIIISLLTFVLVVSFNCGQLQAQVTKDHKLSIASKTDSVLWKFDDISIGKLPAGWKVEATNQKGPLATWQVIEDTTAPSGAHVLAMTNPNHTYGGTFNLCWTDSVSFLDGEIHVRFKAIKGKEDQGGGVIWRVQDKNNYYIARFNPLEDNFRIYYVRNGSRKILVDAKMALSAGNWHTLKIVQQGNYFEGYLNGKKLVDGKDTHFTKIGGVGLWTKADAVTSFDNFLVQVKKDKDGNKNIKSGQKK